MKRAFSIILAAVLLFSVSYAETEHSTEYNEIVNKMISLSLDELKELKLLVDGLIETIEYKEKSKEPTKEIGLDIWVEKYFVDSFNEPTKDKYITTNKMIEGTFSNSAATNRQLKVKLLISLADDKQTPSVGIELYEYGDNKVNNGGVKVNPYSLYLRDSDGGTKYFSCYMPKKGNRIFIDEKYADYGLLTRKDFIEVLKSSKTVKFKMTDDDKYSNSTYSFEIEDTTGFDKAYEWLFSNEE